MKKNINLFKPGLAITSLVLLSACATTQQNSQVDAEQLTTTLETSEFSAAELEARNNELNQREAQLANARAELEQQRSSVAATGSVSDELLPPGAKAGECYARVWVEPTYRTNEESILVREAGEIVTPISARYETATEEVLVKAASYYIEPVPAVYGKDTQTILVEEGSRFWQVDLAKGSAPASDESLATAKAHGINIDAAQPGECFHEHYVPAVYETVTEQVLLEEAYDQVTVTDPQYRFVEKEVLVHEASTRLEEISAVYETVSEEIIDKPAHTVWKRGTGPIQRIDEATGEIMCLVEVPATYKTITKRLLKSPATTRTIDIPAVYKTVKVRELVSNPEEIRSQVPAKYKTISSKKKVADKYFVWHEIHNKDHSSATRTGNKICLVETKPRYETVTQTVVKTPASTRRVEVPAVYETVEVTKLVAAASETREVIPARYETVTSQELLSDGFMEWRSILCETNMTAGTITSIQRALSSKGYNPGPIDGVIGRNTIQAVNKFQMDNGLPTDKYINLETVKALGVAL